LNNVTIQLPFNHGDNTMPKKKTGGGGDDSGEDEEG